MFERPRNKRERRPELYDIPLGGIRGRLEPEFNTLPNKRDRIPELEANAHPGTMAAQRSRYGPTSQ